MTLKSSFLLLLFLCFLYQVKAQRFLTEVFPILDSTIAGVYGTASDYQSNTINLLYDLYEPKGDVLAERPFIIHIHGGGFTSGSRAYPSDKIIAKTMARKGYVVVSIDYRLDPNFSIYNSNSDRRAMTDAMHDAKAAIRYFKANASTFRLDTSLFFLGGESAGAATTLMATFIDKQSEMQPYPMAVPNNPMGHTTNLNVSNKVEAAMCLCGLMLDTNAIEFANVKSLLWNHGTNDSFVPLSLAFQIVQRAANQGIPIQTKLYNGGVHCPWYFGNPNWNLYMDTVIDQITSFLYPNVATVNLNDQINEILIDIYPNPASNKVLIRSPIKLNELTLMDLSGKQVYHTLDILTYVDLSGFTNGVYFLKMETHKGQHIIKRLIVEQ